MKKSIHNAAIALALLALSLPAAARAERIDKGTMEIGGNFFYDTDTAFGGRLDLGLLGGYYVEDGWLLGGDIAFADDDFTSLFSFGIDLERAFELGDPDTVSPFIPYIGGRTAYASAKYKGADNASGLVFGLRAGAKLMLTGDLAIDFSVQGDFATDDVFYDDDGPSKTDITFRIGLRTFLF